ncbi:hypothetical protein PO909_014617 [Leuciscus waleckii]
MERAAPTPDYQGRTHTQKVCVRLKPSNVERAHYLNTANIVTVRRPVAEIQTELPQLKEQLTTQSASLQTIGKTLRGTVVILNTHRVLLNQTVNSRKLLFTIFQNDFDQTQLITALTTDMLWEVSSSNDSLATGIIPLYTVPWSLVQTVLAIATATPTDPRQIHLAYSLGSATPLYVDPEQREVGFLLNLPTIESSQAYRLTGIVKVRFRERNTHIKIRPPDLVAYHDSDTQLYSLPSKEYQTALELLSSKNYNFTLDPELELWSEKKGSQLMNIAPVNTALQAGATAQPEYLTCVQIWTAADTVLCLSTVTDHAPTLVLAFILYRTQRDVNIYSQAHESRFRRSQTESPERGCQVRDHAEPPRAESSASKDHLLSYHHDPPATRPSGPLC